MYENKPDNMKMGSKRWGQNDLCHDVTQNNGLTGASRQLALAAGLKFRPVAFKYGEEVGSNRLRHNFQGAGLVRVDPFHFCQQRGEDLAGDDVGNR